MTKINNLGITLEDIWSVGNKSGDVWCQNVDGKVETTESNINTVKIMGKSIVSQKQRWKWEMGTCLDINLMPAFGLQALQIS